jgi:hypothetical protein
VNLLNGKSFYDSSFYLVKRDTLTTDFVVIYSADQGYVAYDLPLLKRTLKSAA